MSQIFFSLGILISIIELQLFFERKFLYEFIKEIKKTKKISFENLLETEAYTLKNLIIQSILMFIYFFVGLFTTQWKLFILLYGLNILFSQIAIKSSENKYYKILNIL